MILRILINTANLKINKQTARVVRVYNRNVPEGITENSFTQKGGMLAGSGAGTFAELSPGSTGQYLTPDSSEPLGLKWQTPTLTIDDTTNHLINGGFNFAQRQAPGTLTTIADLAYGPDRWKVTRENADIQYIRVDGSSESGLTSPYFGKFKKITNTGKLLLCQPLEYLDTLKFRGKTVNFQLQMKASASKTIKIAVVELQTDGTADTLPTLVSAWGADGTDPTLGANLATIGTPVSCSVTTSWQTFQFTGSFPATSKNLIVMVWSNADFSVNDTLSLAEAGLYFGASIKTWTPRPIAQEDAACKRYCSAFKNPIIAGVAKRLSTNIIACMLSFQEMRTTPTLGQVGSTSFVNATPSGNQIAFYNYVSNAFGTISGSLTITLVDASAISGTIYLTAGTSFGGTTGNVGDIYVGNAAYLYLTAEL
jgi:hypothetical protein